MNVKAIAALIAAVFCIILISIFWSGLVGHNNDQNWQIHQSVLGKMTVIDGAGYYYKGFGTVWTYPRTMEAAYSSHPEESENNQSVRVTFNDAGTAEVSAYVRIQLPTTTDQRRLLHRDFQGNPANIKTAIRAHLVNCVKASGPVMSASENQASRKAEFNQIVEDQMVRGLFKMRRTEIELDDMSVIEAVEQDGAVVTKEKKARVQATEVVTADGKPVVIQLSPLEHYGIQVVQFSITETEYDQQTLKQFSAKKESYLAAEQAKAQRQEEVQQRLMIEEKGRRQVAEIQAEENQKKERALIQATQAQEVASINKQQAVIEGQKKVEVALQTKKEAETLREIASIDAQTAELKKKATISVAEAKQKELELGGSLSERDRGLAQIAADRDAKVAESLSRVGVPSVVIVGGEKGGNVTESLLNMALLRANGILVDAPKQK